MKENTLTRKVRATLLFMGLLFGLAAVGMGVGTSTVQAQVPTPATGQVLLPTATQTLIGGPTATASRTPTLVPVLAEVISEANLRSWPAIGDDSTIVGHVTAGTTLPVVGRWLGYPWLLVLWVDGPNGTAWVFGDLVIIHGDITTVPAVTPPPLPTIEPTLQALQMTATILLQTPGAAETATMTAFFVPTGVYTRTPSGGGGLPGGALPTFTQPPPYAPPEVLASSNSPAERSRIPPAVPIIALGAMGILTLGLGLLRRL